MLHTLSRSPWQCDIGTLLSMLHEGDDLLLIQDGVFVAVNNSYFVEVFISAPITVYILIDDIKARGLVDKISTKINVIGYSDFVNLTVKQPSQINW